MYCTYSDLSSFFKIPISLCLFVFPISHRSSFYSRLSFLSSPLSNFDFRSCPDWFLQFSVYLAVKTGLNPKFSKLSMLSCHMDLEQLLPQFLRSERSIFRDAPRDICNHLGGPAGIMLRPISQEGDEHGKRGDFSTGKSLMDHRSSSGGGGPGSRRSRARKAGAEDAGSDADLSRLSNDSDLESDGDKFFDEEEMEAALTEKINGLLADKEELSGMNSELQKKCNSLLAKEKSLQIQNSAMKAAAEVAPLDADQLAEKEKLFNDTLDLIATGRGKLTKQQAEFDQLAMDLQTRLDDKEFKAGEIGDSFKDFKRYSSLGNIFS
jgi:hypothetical protein